MSKFKKFALLLPLLFVLLFAVSSCDGIGGGGAADIPGPIQLTYWVINSDPIRLPVLSRHVQEFNASQDRIVVEYVPIPQDDALNRINVAVAAGEQPDVTDLLHGWVAGLVLREELLQLDDLYNNWGARDEMVPALIAEIRNLDANGGLYMLPATSNTHTIWVRTDWLAEQGITNQHTWTWDDFISSVQAMTDPSQIRFGHTLRGGPGSAATLFEMIFSYSGEQVFENNVTTLNRPHNVAFIERYFALYGVHTPEGDLTAGHMEITANFGTGIAGSMIHNLGSYANHVDAFQDNPDAFEAIPMPYSRLGTRNLSTSVHGYAAFANTPHPEAAFEFITWMINAQNNSEWNETIGQLPSNVRVMQDAWFNEAHHISTMTDAINSPVTTSNGLPQFLPEFAPINNNIAGPAIQEALLGQITVQQLLDTWADALNAALEDYLTHVVGQ